MCDRTFDESVPLQAVERVRRTMSERRVREQESRKEEEEKRRKQEEVAERKRQFEWQLRQQQKQQREHAHAVAAVRAAATGKTSASNVAAGTNVSPWSPEPAEVVDGTFAVHASALVAEDCAADTALGTSSQTEAVNKALAAAAAAVLLGEHSLTAGAAETMFEDMPQTYTLLRTYSETQLGIAAC